MPGLYLKSCERMTELADNSIDLIVTSPPYWVDTKDAFLAPAAPRSLPRTRPATRGVPDTYPLPTYNAFLEWLERCFAECYRVLKPGRFCAVEVATTLVHKQMFALPFHLVGRLEKIGFQFHQDIQWHRWRGWDRRGGVLIQHPYPGYYYPNRVLEYILVFVKPGQAKLFAGRSPAQRESSRIAIDDLYTKEIGTNLWHVAAVQPHSLQHPCPFPEELAYRLITLYSYRGDKVLDPFLGSGTTAKVARLTGREYYGYEVNPAFLKLARRRLREPTLQRQDWISRFQRLSILNRGSMPPKRAAQKEATIEKAAPEKAASPEAVFPGQPRSTEKP